MTAPRLTATRTAGGKETPLHNVTELWVRASLDSPAVAMRAVAAVEAAPGELRSVRVEYAGKELFAGAVDQQQFSLSQGGRLLALEARSQGAALLDNEALPCTLQGPTMTAVFRLFAEPYGFVLVNPAPGGGLGTYTVHKGLCEWDAVCGFTRRVYGIRPHIKGDMLVVGRPGGGAELVIGSRGLGYTELSHTVAPYHMLSKVVLRDAAGGYGTAVHSADAGYYGVLRKRYIIPPDEFVDAPGMDANQRIRRGLLQGNTVRAVLPGIVDAPPGTVARVADDALAMGGLLVREVVWRQDRAGLRTELSMVRAAYWD